MAARAVFWRWLRCVEPEGEQKIASGYVPVGLKRWQWAAQDNFGIRSRREQKRMILSAFADVSWERTLAFSMAAERYRNRWTTAMQKKLLAAGFPSHLDFLTWARTDCFRLGPNPWQGPFGCSCSEEGKEIVFRQKNQAAPGWIPPEPQYPPKFREMPAGATYLFRSNDSSIRAGDFLALVSRDTVVRTEDRHAAIARALEPVSSDSLVRGILFACWRD